MKKIFCLILAAFLYSNVNAQYSNYWYLGVNGGLNFNTSAPTILTNGQSPSNDYTSTMSDASGNLLFYTDGITVWNKNQVVMPNGTGLIGHFTAGSCALIVPVPCNKDKYVIFHTTEFSNPGWLHYTVVDMSLNAGLGDVVTSQKNISLGSGWTEKMCAYYNSSGQYYWLVSHKWMSDQFVAFKIDASTIATTSVVSSIGSIHNCGSVGGVHDAMGQLTISQDGLKIVNALTCQDKYEIFDFNITNGTITNSIAIPGNTGNAWGTAFSPDSKKLYTTSIFGADTYQYDISTYTGSAIIASKVSIYNMGSTGYNWGYIELGPNGKLYMTRPNSNFLSVINTPNLSGSACSFSLNGQSLGSAVIKWGLSRIAYNIGGSGAGTLSVIPSFSNVTCNGLSNGSATIAVSPSGTYTYNWVPGGFSTSVVNTLNVGSYTVTVTDGVCNTNTVSISITQPTPISLNITPSQQICSGSNAVLSSTVSGGTPAYTYSWSNGGTFSGINVSPTITKNYTLFVTDANGCLNTAVSTVTVVDCTNIEEQSGPNTNIEIYPNPTSDFILISSKTFITEVSIINYLGEKIDSIKINDVNGKLNLKNLSVGLYFLEFSFENSSRATKRILKTE